MPRAARFKIQGRLDGNGREMSGTVIIERQAALFSVRPHKRRRLYTLQLSDVADMVVARVIRAEVFARRLARKAQKGRK